MDIFKRDKRPLRMKTSRQFWINQQENSKFYPSNFVKTSKYTVFDFLPSMLYQQFSKFANIYFLLFAILQSIPIISPLTPITAILPLIFVLFISIAREGYEDYNRYINDQIQNSTESLRMVLSSQSNKTIESVKWKNIIVGDLLYIKKDECFPADLVILSSSNQDSSAFINTSSLDGEKTLKPKESFKKTQDIFNPQKKVYQKDMIHYHFQAQKPDPYIYQYDGSIIIDDEKDFLYASNFVMRGAYLKNTQWIIGVVVYTGYDTKIMRNEEKAKVKTSEIDKNLNQLIISVLAFQFIICLILAIVYNEYREHHQSGISYIVYNSTLSNGSFLVFFTYAILTNTMLPISLLVSLEFVKVFQSYFMGKDLDVKKNQHFLQVNTSSINEELGMIEYIFSDKTGTLTCNKMDFKYFVIGNIVYGDENPSNDFQDIQLQKDLSQITPSLKQVKNYNFDQYQLIYEYFLLLATCHECIIEQSDGINEQIIYQGLSPDEITLVNQAANLGFIYKGKVQNKLIVSINGKDKEIEILYSFAFDSDRKRMSVIIRDNDLIKIYCKGADSIILNRLSKNLQQNNLDVCQQKLNDFSLIGLRTLCMAMRFLSEEELKQFELNIKNLDNQNDRNKLILNLASDIEDHLYLLGLSAIEDKLQPNVGQVISDLLKTNIKVWMLTGDKLETAENIAKSCNLILPNMNILYIREETSNELEINLQSIMTVINKVSSSKDKKSLIVEGHSLRMIQLETKLVNLFLQIVLQVDSVVCCRATPKQKAEMVRLIRSQVGKITLAIGDGANDCNMIQEANIGVGIFGNEGMQAVLTSDFAIGEFQCLHKLLFYHGRQNYIRISYMILYFFYKNMLFTIPQFFYAFICLTSGQTIFDAYYISGYNMIFTAFPLIMTATFDQILNYKQLNTSQKNCNVRINYKMKEIQSKLYYVGQNKTIFFAQNFYFYIGLGLFHSLIIFLISDASLKQNYIINAKGQTIDLWTYSINLFTIIVIIANLVNFVLTKYWTTLNFAVSLIFFIVYVLWIIIYDQILNQMTGSGLIALGNTYLYFQSFIIVGIVFLSSIFGIVFIKEQRPTFQDKAEIYFAQNKNNQENYKEQFINKKQVNKIEFTNQDKKQNFSSNQNQMSKLKKNLKIDVDLDEHEKSEEFEIKEPEIKRFNLQNND